VGYIHAYCRTPEEESAARKRRRDARKQVFAEAAAQFAADKERFFPEPPEVLE